MYRSKRDVDRYVTEVDRNIKNEVERGLKAFTIAKLYYNIGEYSTALVHLEKYDSVRKSSASALRLRGQVYEGLAASAEAGDKSRLNGLALQSFRRSVELDLSQTDLLLKIGELMLALPIEEQGKARYWLEEAEKIYPHNKTLSKLRNKISRAAEGLEDNQEEEELEEGEVNGNANESDDNVAYWSASTGGGSSFLNTSGLARLEMRETSTSTPRAGGGSASLMANSQPRRFAPRPSPERLANQFRSVELAQERVLNAVQENGKSLLETLELLLAEARLGREAQEKVLNVVQENEKSQLKTIEPLIAELRLGRDENSKLAKDMLDIQANILNELHHIKEDTSRQLRDNTRALKDATSELVNLCDDMTRQMKSLVTVTKASRDETDEQRLSRSAVKPASVEAQPDINELMMQQYARLPPAHLLALMQMSGMNQFAEANMMTAAARTGPVLPQHVMIPPQQTPVAPAPLQQIPLAQTQIPSNIVGTPSRPPNSVFDMSLASNTTSWPASSPTPQYPLPPVVQPLASNVPSVSTPSKDTSSSATKTTPIKPSILGTPTVGVNLSMSSSVTPVAATTKPSVTLSSTLNNEAKNSPFSTFASSPFANTGAVSTPTTSKTLSSKPDPATSSFFSSLNAVSTPSTGFSFGTPSPAPTKKDTVTTLGGSFFAGAAAEAAQRISSTTEDQDDGAHDESADHDHDPHFEPIIPLPELVQVKTGEEEEEELFAHKAKMYRFDPEAKEWKERGVGKLKILKHPVKGTYRLLLRREQVHKIAANHAITKEIELKPLQSSTTALCYYAMDFADEELHLEHLAVRFKLEETRDEFKKIFEQCQEELRKKGTPVKSDTPATTDAEKEKPKGESVKKDLSLLEQFKPKTGSWECPGCMCRNDADKIQCPACQTAQPGHEDEVKQMNNTSSNASAFKFNSGPAVAGGGFNLAPASSTTPSTQSGFKFGVNTATAFPASSAASDFKFGAGPTTSAPATGFSFGKQDATSSAPLTTGFSFGKKVESTPAGGAADKPATSGFSFSKPVLPVATAPVEKPAEPAKPSPFATFSFGLKTEEVKKAEPEKKSTSAGVDLSESKNLASFADLATTTGFGFGTAKSNFTFSGAGAPVFGQSKKETSTSAAAANEDDDDGQVEGADHDPHFEPIIPLPELVQVTTGEEDEEELFGQKAKCYRFDPDTKEWKERGVGKIKILKHSKKGTYRVLLRREQVHKIALNHAITKDIEIKPMNTSTTAVCYYAMDFAEETLKLEHLAVRFKLEESVQEFKRVFEKCKADIEEKGSPTKQDPSKADKVDPCKGLKDKVEEIASLDQFKPKSDSWECPGCMCRNDGDKLQCPSCETAKPGSKPNEAAKQSTPFAAATSGSIFGGKTPTTGGFSFSTFAPNNSNSIFSGLGGPAAKVEELKAVETADKEELSFEGLGLKLNNANDAAQVADKIAKTKTIKTLTFSGNTIGIEAAEVIGKALEKHPEFERAHWKDMFTGRMKTEIPPALKHLSRGIMTAQAHLVELDLSDNAFGPIGAEGIADLLKSPSCFTLKEIRLNNTGCGVTGGKLLAKTLLECYHNSGKKLAIKVFVLGRSRQENEGAKALAQVFKLMGSLEEVVMPQNGIYHEGIAALADAFSNNPNLRILNMNDNTFTEKGAQALAKALPNLQQLAILNLGDCLLKTKGAQLIADALKQGHPNLEEIYLDSNEIRYEGGKSIVDAVANKKSLKTLKIDGNQFGSIGCGKLMKQLKDCGKAQVVDEIEDDEEPDDDDEDQENGESATVDRARYGSGDEEDDEDDENEEDEEEEDTNIMFDGLCRLYERIVPDGSDEDPNSVKEERSLGIVDLKILYDDDVYGARIVAVEHHQEDEEEEEVVENGTEPHKTVCNHLIAIQTALTTRDSFRKLEWSALDFSRDPPTYRHFTAEFEDEEMGREFRDIFTEGKDLAEQSEILEQTDVNPEEMYYGQGGDYEEE